LNSTDKFAKRLASDTIATNYAQVPQQTGVLLKQM
jgi:hypothetical protein